MPVGVSYNKSSSNNGSTASSFEYVRAKIVTGKSAGRVYFLDQMEDGFDGEGKAVQIYRSYKFNFEDLPDFPKLPNDTVISECQVVWDNKESKIVGIGPYNGSYKGSPSELGPKTPDGSKPMSRIQKKKNLNVKKGQAAEYEDVNFWCIHTITDTVTDGGLWVGAKGFQFLKDKFYRRDDGMTDIMGDPEKTTTHAARLREWGDQLGLFNDDIPWPDDGNVLPILQDRMHEKPQEIILIFRKGSVQEIQKVYKGVVQSVKVFMDDEPVAPDTTANVSAGKSDPTFG